jgi:hypothetical protein
MKFNLKMGLFAALLFVVFASLPSANQARPINGFDICLQDDSTPAVQLQWSSVSGAYRFCCGGTAYTGTGAVSNKGKVSSLKVEGTDRYIVATFDGGTNRGSAALRYFPTGVVCTIADRNTANDTCTCGMTG